MKTTILNGDKLIIPTNVKFEQKVIVNAGEYLWIAVPRAQTGDYKTWMANKDQSNKAAIHKQCVADGNENGLFTQFQYYDCLSSVPSNPIKVKGVDYDIYMYNFSSPINNDFITLAKS